MAKKKAKKGAWGGVRPGSGAKSKPKDRVGKIVSTYFYPADQIALDRVRVTLGCSKNEALRQAIREMDERLASEVLESRRTKAKKKP